jgi:hypothetical protein
MSGLIKFLGVCVCVCVGGGGGCVFFDLINYHASLLKKYILIRPRSESLIISS